LIRRAQETLETILAWLLNPIFYRLRNIVRFSRRKSFVDQSVSLEALPNYAQDQLKSARHRKLRDRFGLEQYSDRISWSSLYGAYFFLDVLETARSVSNKMHDWPDALEIMDVGTKNFDAAPAIYQFFRHQLSASNRKVEITGIEIDAYRVYRSFFSRYDVGKFYENLITVEGEHEIHRYLPGDFLNHHESYNVITCFFPFMSPFALLAWGLPRAMLAPKRFLQHIIDQLRPGGLAIILNQTEAERDVQVALLKESSANFESFEIVLEFREGKPTAFLHLIHG
jgi:SAM-dependent methyltransferase